MLASCTSLSWSLGCHDLLVRRRDLDADAKRRVAEVPDYALQEATEAVDAAIRPAEGDLRSWLQAALEAQRDLQPLSTVTPGESPNEEVEKPAP